MDIELELFEFHAYAQKYNLLTDSAFDGKVDGFDAAVIVL